MVVCQCHTYILFMSFYVLSFRFYFIKKLYIDFWVPYTNIVKVFHSVLWLFVILFREKYVHVFILGHEHMSCCIVSALSSTHSLYLSLRNALMTSLHFLIQIQSGIVWYEHPDPAWVIWDDMNAVLYPFLYNFIVLGHFFRRSLMPMWHYTHNNHRAFNPISYTFIMILWVLINFDPIGFNVVPLIAFCRDKSRWSNMYVCSYLQSNMKTKSSVDVADAEYTSTSDAVRFLLLCFDWFYCWWWYITYKYACICTQFSFCANEFLFFSYVFSLWLFSTYILYIYM